ncbi:MAG: DUF255 domain-containing protein [Planctomycetota bacterium]
MKPHIISTRRALLHVWASSPVAAEAPAAVEAPVAAEAPAAAQAPGAAEAPGAAQARYQPAARTVCSWKGWLPLCTVLGGHLLAQLLAPSVAPLPVLWGEEPPSSAPQAPAAPAAISWQTDLATAQALAAKTNRPLLLHFTSDHCPPCQRMEKTVFVDPQVSRVMGEHFVAVKVNVERQPEVARSYRVDRWPTDILCAPDGKELTRGTSEQQPARFLAKLQHFAPTAHPMAKTKWNEAAIRPVNLATPDPTPPQLPLGLDGFCPVTLLQQKNWKKGDSQWGAIHRERVYWFTGPAEQQQFLANPDAYSPALAGFDIVRFVELRQRVDGRRQHGVWHRGQMFLFADEATLNQFTADAASYLERGEQLLRESAAAAHTTPPSGAPDRRGLERQ